MKSFTVISVVLGVTQLGLALKLAEIVPNPTVTAHYRDLNCTPDLCSPGKIFNCSEFESQDPTKCYVNGKVYSDFAMINQKEFGLCDIAPVCSNGSVKFDPAACPLINPITDKACIEVANSCCGRYVCGEEIDKLQVCYLDDVKYYAGERMYTKEKECFCDENWDNTTNVHANNNCRNKICSSVFRDLHKYRQHCAPIYNSWVERCPVGMKCPEDTDEIVKAEVPESSEVKCQYGESELGIGDQVKVQDSDSGSILDCRCTTPPFVTCIETTIMNTPPPHLRIASTSEAPK